MMNLLAGFDARNNGVIYLSKLHLKHMTHIIETNYSNWDLKPDKQLASLLSNSGLLKP